MLSGDINGWIQGAGAGIFPGGDINNLTVSTTPAVPAGGGGAYLHLTFLTPPSDWSIPRLLHYPFYSIDKTVTTESTAAGLAPGGTDTFTTNAQVRHEISKRLYLIPSSSYYLE